MFEFGLARFEGSESTLPKSNTFLSIELRTVRETVVSEICNLNNLSKMKLLISTAILLVVGIEESFAHHCHGVRKNCIPETPKGTWLLAFATPIAGGNGSSSSWFGKYSCGLFNNCWGCRCTTMVLDECDDNNRKLSGYITSYNDFSGVISIKQFESKVGNFEGTSGYQASIKGYVNIKGAFGSKNLQNEKTEKNFNWILVDTDQKTYYVMLICDTLDSYTCSKGPLVLIFFRHKDNFKCDRLSSYPNIVESLKKYDLGPDKIDYKYIPQDECSNYYGDVKEIKKIQWCGCGDQD
ncbi:hypothetical protein M8J76_007242 [Diaphorina citri]|nr:hypothetical protein M8J76_007242 [Diaphorina citri]